MRGIVRGRPGQGALESFAHIKRVKYTLRSFIPTLFARLCQWHLVKDHVCMNANLQLYRLRCVTGKGYARKQANTFDHFVARLKAFFVDFPQAATMMQVIRTVLIIFEPYDHAGKWITELALLLETVEDLHDRICHTSVRKKPNWTASLPVAWRADYFRMVAVT